jgi:hypothetical protein
MLVCWYFVVVSIFYECFTCHTCHFWQCHNLDCLYIGTYKLDMSLLDISLPELSFVVLHTYTNLICLYILDMSCLSLIYVMFILDMSCFMYYVFNWTVFCCIVHMYILELYLLEKFLFWTSSAKILFYVVKSVMLESSA